MAARSTARRIRPSNRRATSAMRPIAIQPAPKPSMEISKPAAARSKTGWALISTTCFPTTRRAPRRGRPATAPPPIRNGPRPAAAGATTPTTISKLSSRPSRRSPIIWPSNWRWRSSDPVHRMIGQYLIDLIDDAGYLDRRSALGRREARRDAARRRGGACGAADLRAARRRRAQSHRVPCHPAQGARPVRSGDAGAGRPARSPGQARPAGAAPDLRGRATKISPT